MATFEEMDSNGGVHSQVSCREGLITYKRKFARPQAPYFAEIAEDLVEKKILDMPKRKRKVKDIGWEHGVMIGGNRFHWQCNWCGTSRTSGGVSRLKKHIAGIGDTIKCRKVPEHIAKAMKEHLLHKGMFKKKSHVSWNADNRRSLEFSLDDDSSDGDSGQIDLDMEVRSDICGTLRASQSSMTVNVQLKTSINEQTKNVLHETVLPARRHADDGTSKVYCYWRNVLASMLQFPGVSGDGIIRSCIRHALASSPSSLTRNFKMKSSTDDMMCPEVVPRDYCGVLADQHIETVKCSNLFLNILLSEKFALLCNLLCENFEDVKFNSIFNLSLISRKMENGDYEQSPNSFDQDIQLVWKKFQRIGEEIVALANSLSAVSQVGDSSMRKKPEEKHEASSQVAVQELNSADSIAFASEIPSSESDNSVKPDQTVPFCPAKLGAYKYCGNEVGGSKNVSSNGCNLLSHLSRNAPASVLIPTQSWHCAACSPRRCDILEPGITNIDDKLHEECVVCDRLEVPEAIEDLIEGNRGTTEIDDSRESSISMMEHDEQPQFSRTAISHLCKLCGKCEDENKRFLICGNSHCPYKFYHIRCLTSSQIASQWQSPHCWHCPSCLCRACHSDKDDDKIVMCDGCDEAYHTYCMKPPRTSIPRGKWYCIPCNVVRAREGMRKYEGWILKQHGMDDFMQANGDYDSMEMLLKAAEKLSSEESVATGRYGCFRRFDL